MKWFTGGIAEAVQTSKQKGAIFVVYVEGKDEQSIKITDAINNGETGQKLENDNFVAIKIEAESLPHQQFIEIFNERRVPLLYFIGRNGTALDAITGADDLESLSNRIEKVLQKAGITISSTSSSASLIQNEQSVVSPPPDSNIVCENGVCKIKPSSSTASTSSESDGKEYIPEDKVDIARELLQKKKQEKEREEREKIREREMERRRMGQSVQQLKKWQEDQELKQLKEEREKEKREKQQARDRVLAQIAQDKAERLAKSAPAPETAKPQVVSPSRPNGNTTRLQFKLPDGSTSMREFSNSDPLQTVVAYIKTDMNVPFSNFKLSTTFPKREFTENDYSQTLLDLQLCPTAVILVLPVNNRVVASGPGGGTFNNLIWAFLTPFFHVFGMIRNFIFGAPNVAAKKTQTAEPGTQPENPRQRVRDSTVIKRQGNVHRLSDRRDSDEDGNTWNGNSTQQM